MADSKSSPYIPSVLERHITKNWFTEFAAYSEENEANLPLPLDVQKLKAFQLQGGFVPLTRGSVTGPRWGLCPQTAVIGSRSPWRWHSYNFWFTTTPLETAMSWKQLSSSYPTFAWIWKIIILLNSVNFCYIG